MKPFFFSLLFGLICLDVHASELEFEVEKYQLKNGLTVLLHQDHSIPVYSFHLWYRVGSRDEEENRTGLAHFFEHLMFKGTKNYPEGSYESIISKNGGSHNAFTNRDYTGYFVNMPKGTLKTAIKLEADRMVNLEINSDNIKTEREVVKEERRLRVDNSPFGIALEKIYENSYKSSSYRWPIIGYPKHLNQSSVEDFRAFYKRYYSPNNAIIVIAGDFKPKRAKRWIKKYFGKIPPNKFERKPISPNTQTKAKRIGVKRDFSSTVLALSMKGASISQKEAYALDLISHVMGSGNASRLYRDLVNKRKLALNVQNWNFTPLGAGLIMFFSSLRPRASTYAVEKRFKRAFRNLARNGITADELNRAKKAVNLGTVNGLKTIYGKARGLALNEVMFGDYKRLFSDVKKYQELDLNYVNSVARRYFKSKINIVEVGK